MNKSIYTFVTFCALASVMAAQSALPTSRRYATQAYLTKQVAQNPGIAASRSAIEQQIFDFRRFGQSDTLTIPVVFHILQNGQNVGQSIGVSDVQAQLRRLNYDFFDVTHPYLADAYKQGEGIGATYLKKADRTEGFARKAGRPLLWFCLADTDPQGQPTSGINFVSTATKFVDMSDSMKVSALGGVAPWAPTRYCNVWVVPLGGDLAGFAQMPGGVSATDGIVVNARYFARQNYVNTYGLGQQDAVYALGRSLTHLMGSYLNLLELWNDAQPCSDDLVDDTPLHNAPNGTLDAYSHRSFCEGNPVEMTMNLMDATPDTAQYLFTFGQIVRMQAVLATNGARAALPYRTGKCFGQNLRDDGAASERDGNLKTLKSPTSRLLVRAYPNPTTGDFVATVEGIEETTAVSMQVFNAFGQLMWSGKASGPDVTVPAKGWSPGIYTLTVLAPGEQRTIKVVLE